VYCPVDGDEYREGITRCPEHDVDLVEDPPDLEEPAPIVGRLGGPLVVVFGILVVGALVYAIAGAASSLLYANAIRLNTSYDEAPAVLQEIANAAFPIALGAFGVIAAALLLRTFSATTVETAVPEGEDRPPPDVSSGRWWGIAGHAMRLLFALLIAFTLLWATTGIITAKLDRELQYRAFDQVDYEPPGDSDLNLLTLNSVSYYGGVACLTIMGAVLSLRAYGRLGTRRLPR
jgi:hypothetical protein